MYIYLALINAQSTHIMHINLNMNEQCCCSSFDTIHTQWTTFKVRRKSKRSWKVTVFRCEWDQLSICCPSLGYGAQLGVEECHFKSRCNVLCNIVLACSLCCIKLYYSICSKGAWVMEYIFVLLPALVHLQCDTENCKILHLFTWAQAVWKDTWWFIFLICKFCRECGCGMHVPERQWCGECGCGMHVTERQWCRECGCGVHVPERPVMCKIFHVLDLTLVRHLWDEMKRLGSWWTCHRITMSFRKLWSACGMQVPQACLPSEKKHVWNIIPTFITRDFLKIWKGYV